MSLRPLGCIAYDFMGGGHAEFAVTSNAFCISYARIKIN